MNFYSIDINNWIADTAGKLSMVEEGAYIRMTNQYFRLEEPLPLELSKLFRMVQAHTDQERDAVKAILAEFFIQTDDGFISDEMDEKKENIYVKSEKARKSAEARWAKKVERKSTKNANASKLNANASENDANELFLDAKEKEKEKEITTFVAKPKPARKKTVVTSEHFQKWWDAYPQSDRKVAKGKCLEFWKKKRYDGEADQIMAYLEAKMDDYTKENLRWCPETTKFLKDRKWDGFEPTTKYDPFDGAI
jgi:uncharacterized protein YdaU (DUF1376 family)